MSTGSGQARDPGERFGPYVVYERLGVGGMATVHRAKEAGIEGFERTVALKRLLPHLAEDAEFVQSFVREAKLAALLHHENIVQIYNLGRVGAHYFISMEYIEGWDLRHLLRRAQRVTGPPPLAVVVSLLLELCDALHYAHTRRDDSGRPLGLIHRDVSPSNLLVASSGHLKIIDFGIAKATAQQLRTRTGTVKGKLAYLAPEAIRGKPLDARADVFSAGVIAHELLTARPLFASKNDYRTIQRIQRGELAPPSARNPVVPPELDALVLRALERDRDRRWQSAAEMRDALEDLRVRTAMQATNRQVAAFCSWAFSTPEPATDRALRAEADRTGGGDQADQDQAGDRADGGTDGSLATGTPAPATTGAPGGDAAPGASDDRPVPDHAGVAAAGAPPDAANRPDTGVETSPGRPARSGAVRVPGRGAAHLSDSAYGPRDGSPDAPGDGLAARGTGSRAPDDPGAGDDGDPAAGVHREPRSDSPRSDEFDTIHSIEEEEAIDEVAAMVWSSRERHAPVLLPDVPDVASTGAEDDYCEFHVADQQSQQAPRRPTTDTVREDDHAPDEELDQAGAETVLDDTPTLVPDRHRPPSAPTRPLPALAGPDQAFQTAAPGSWPLGTHPPPARRQPRASRVVLPARAASPEGGPRPRRRRLRRLCVGLLRRIRRHMQGAARRPGRALAGPALTLVPLLVVAIGGGIMGLRWLSRATTASGDVPVTIAVEPRDATIELAGVHYTGSPFTTRLRPGRYRVLIRRPGHKSWLSTLELARGEHQTLHVALQPGDSSAAKLSVHSTPPGLFLTIDGRKIATPTPLDLDLPPGPHELVLHAGTRELWRHRYVARRDTHHAFYPVLTGADRSAASPVPRRSSDRSLRPPAASVPAPVEPLPVSPGPHPAVPAPTRDTRTPPGSSADTPAATTPEAVAPARAPAAPAPVTAPPPATTPGTRASSAAPLTAASSPETVSSSELVRTHGTLPRRTDHMPPGTVRARLCMDRSGTVTSADLLSELPEEAETQLETALLGWRYEPYLERGTAIPVCFTEELQLAE